MYLGYSGNITLVCMCVLSSRVFGNVFTVSVNAVLAQMMTGNRDF